MNWRKVLTWEAEAEPGAGPDRFRPVDPIDRRIYRIQNPRERAGKLYARLQALHDDPSVLYWNANYSEVTYGYVTVMGRSKEEARMLLENNYIDNSETTDSDSFEIDVDSLEQERA